MINVRDVTISDLLPYTMKTPKNIALSKAFGEMTRYLYDTLQSVVFWADIKTASDMLLNSMAAEIDCPFYENGMSIEQKRELIAVSDIYNSRTGTTSAVDKLIAAAFKNGNIQEWYEYGGNPYCFKINMDSELSKSEMNDFNYFFSMLRKIKNARSKLEVINISKDLPTSDFDDIMNSIINKLLILPDDTIVYPGHGKSTMIENEKPIYLELKPRKM